MKTKIHSVLAAILLLAAFSCSKDSSNNAGTSTNNRINSMSGTQPSNAFIATMDDNQSPSIVGQWLLTYNWYCDGSLGYTVTTFNSDGTWSNDQGNTGLWVVGRHILIFTFDNYETTYSGVIGVNLVQGIQTTFEYAGSLQGCFHLSPYSGSFTKQRDGNMDASGKGK